jgi:hypothetical protein
MFITFCVYQMLCQSCKTLYMCAIWFLLFLKLSVFGQYVYGFDTLSYIQTLSVILRQCSGKKWVHFKLSRREISPCGRNDYGILVRQGMVNSGFAAVHHPLYTPWNKVIVYYCYHLFIWISNKYEQNLHIPKTWLFYSQNIVATYWQFDELQKYILYFFWEYHFLVFTLRH